MNGVSSDPRAVVLLSKFANGREVDAEKWKIRRSWASQSFNDIKTLVHGITGVKKCKLRYQDPEGMGVLNLTDDDTWQQALRDWLQQSTMVLTIYFEEESCKKPRLSSSEVSVINDEENISERRRVGSRTENATKPYNDAIENGESAETAIMTAVLPESAYTTNYEKFQERGRRVLGDAGYVINPGMVHCPLCNRIIRNSCLNQWGAFRQHISARTKMHNSTRAHTIQLRLMKDDSVLDVEPVDASGFFPTLDSDGAQPPSNMHYKTTWRYPPITTSHVMSTTSAASKFSSMDECSPPPPIQQ